MNTAFCYRRSLFAVKSNFKVTLYMVLKLHASYSFACLSKPDKFLDAFFQKIFFL